MINSLTHFPSLQVEVAEHVFVELEYIPATNATLAINKIPLLRQLTVFVDPSAPTSFGPMNITLSATFEGTPIMSDIEERTQTVQPGRRIMIDLAAKSRVRHRRLPEITEATEATLNLTLEHDGTVVEHEATIQILAPNEWINSPPFYQSLVAFSQPNSSEITPILQHGMDVLLQETGDGSMQGYQAGSKRAIEIAAALFDALSVRGIRYINPPASFERTGQKIRSSSQVLQDRMGTCIDLSIAFTAAAEQAGLNPAIIILEGHALAGIYTTADADSRPVIYNEAEIVNVVQSGRLIPIETVSFTAHTPTTFAEAVEQAQDTLRTTTSHGLVNVHAARYEGTRPIPTVASLDAPVNEVLTTTPTTTSSTFDIDGVVKNPEPTFATTSPQDREEVPQRIVQWKKELLDLSFRNRLLNLRPNKEVFPLIIRHGMLGELDDKVHDGTTITLLAHDEISENSRLQGYSSIKDFGSERIAEALTEQNRVFLETTEARYQRELTNLRRTMRTLHEETGSANFYLAMGSMIIERSGSETSEAPLFLIPVRLHTRSSRSHFEISVDTSQNATPNYSLVEWLRQRHGVNIASLENPPVDHSGLDIELALRGISEDLINANLPFAIKEHAHLMIAKFSTYGMWKDLDQHWQSFMKAPVFRHLTLSPGNAFEDPAGTENLDDMAVQEENLPLPIPADGAQLRAITAAGEGRSFVLEGPPGTGKSQTITNLIAHCMAEGKSVLFVAEKQAALQVVSQRLQKVGLEPFTLNLHGQEQSPTALRQQLKDSIDAEIHYDSMRWDILTKQLAASLKPLAHYPDAIHKKNAIGQSLWEAVSYKEHVGDGPALYIDDAYVRNAPLPVTELVSVLEKASKLSATLSKKVRSRWSFVGESATTLDGDTFEHVWASLTEAYGHLKNNPEIQQLFLSGTTAEEVAESLGHYAKIPEQQRFDQSGLESAENALPLLRSLKTKLITLAGQSSAVLQVFNPLFISDGDYQACIDAADETAKFFGKKKRLNKYRELLIAAVQPDLVDSVNVQEQHAPERIRPLLYSLEPVRNKSQQLREEIAAIPEIADLAALSPLDPQVRAELERRISVLEQQTRLIADNPWLLDLYATDVQALATAALTIPTAWNRWTTMLGASDSPITAQQSQSSWVQFWLDNMEQWHQDYDQFGIRVIRQCGEWKSYENILDAAKLPSLLDELEELFIPIEKTDLAIRRGIADASIRERISMSQLEDFTHEIKDRQLTDLADTMHQLREEATKALPAQLIRRRPYQSGRLEGQVAQLRRMLDAQRNARSFRSLFSEFGQEILTIAPCVFVSPASLATYIEPGAQTFDIVVFDEASQITVDQAMGALGRAHSAVIVGDSKQMPPTRVGKASFDQEDTDDVDEVPEDLESILAEAVESQIPRLWLTWHYRSKDESLIAFSNAQYYEGRLSSLPSPGSLAGAGIELRRVNGQFIRDRGPQLRTNPIEAEHIVAEIQQRLHNPLTAHESIGVVTFNIQQRNLVLDLLESSEDPLVQQALAQSDDPIFVKNLENVQGDERDVILFSTAFSKQTADKPMPLNFGPLTSKGGEKRLNVAITRARKTVVLFSSFDPHEIDLKRTSSQGMADLRAYMELARDGAPLLPSSRNLHVDENTIRDELARRLIERGWEVETNYGLSSFSLDLVLRPKGSTHWHLAILLDGPPWAKMPTVADRDLTPELLQPLMNWAGVQRIWLPDWITSPESVLARIDQHMALAEQTVVEQEARIATIELENAHRLQTVQSEAKHQQTKEDAAREAALAEMESNVFGEIDPIELENLVEDLLAPTLIGSQTQPDRELHWDIEEPHDRGADAGEDELTTLSSGETQTTETSAHPYVALEPHPLGSRDEIESSLTRRRVEECRRIIEDHLINRAGPVPIQKLRVAIVQGFGRQRTSASINKRIDKLIPADLIFDDGTGTKFVWPRDTDPHTWQVFRASDGHRTVDDIPLIELQNAMTHVSETMMITDDEDLLRKTLELFGLKRLTAPSKTRLEAAHAALES